MFKKEARKIFIKHKLFSKVGFKSRKCQELKMSMFFSSPHEDKPIRTPKFINNIQTYMVEKMNIYFNETYKLGLFCNSCKLSERNQYHLLYCSMLIRSNQLVSNIPEYGDSFNDDDPKKQCFIATFKMENTKKIHFVENK